MLLVHNQSLQWCHNERDGVSYHQLQDCLLNRLFRCRSNKTSKLSVTGLCVGNSPATGEFPTQRASNAEKCFHWMTSSYNIRTESVSGPHWSYIKVVTIINTECNNTTLLLFKFSWPMFLSEVFVLINSSLWWAVSPTFGLNTHQGAKLQFRSYDVAMQSGHIDSNLSRTRTTRQEMQSRMTIESSIDINPQNVKFVSYKLLQTVWRRYNAAQYNTI